MRKNLDGWQWVISFMADIGWRDAWGGLYKSQHQAVMALFAEADSHEITLHYNERWSGAAYAVYKAAHQIGVIESEEQ